MTSIDRTDNNLHEFEIRPLVNNTEKKENKCWKGIKASWLDFRKFSYESRFLGYVPFLGAAIGVARFVRATEILCRDRYSSSQKSLANIQLFRATSEVLTLALIGYLGLLFTDLVIMPIYNCTHKNEEHRPIQESKGLRTRNVVEPKPVPSLQKLKEMISSDIEVNQQEGALFRGTDDTTKAMSSFQQAYWIEKFKEQLAGKIQSIPTNLFIDKDENNNSFVTNKETITECVIDILNELEELTKDNAPQMREFYGHLSAMVNDKHRHIHGNLVGDKHVRALFFLRLVGPALTNANINWPNLELQKNQNKNLTVIAKILQNLANGVKFGDKEPHLAFFNNLHNVRAVKESLDQIVDNLKYATPTPVM